MIQVWVCVDHKKSTDFTLLSFSKKCSMSLGRNGYGSDDIFSPRVTHQPTQRLGSFSTNLTCRAGGRTGSRPSTYISRTHTVRLDTTHARMTDANGPKPRPSPGGRRHQKKIS